jgi:Na+/phosphate symporter
MQTRRLSLFEAVASTAIGLLVAMAVQAWIFPLLGVYLTFGQNVSTTVLMTAVSIARSYGVRRMFVWIGRK